MNLMGKKIQISIRCLPLDAPDRCSVCATKQFNSYSSCLKCFIRGDVRGRRMTFSDSNMAFRTDESFKCRFDPEYHSKDDVRHLKKLLVLEWLVKYQSTTYTVHYWVI